MLRGHGDDGVWDRGAVRADFSRNVIVCPALTCALREHVMAQFCRVERYPEVGADLLTEKLAARVGLAASEVLLTPGAVGAIYWIAQAFRGAKSAIAIPTFTEYEDAGRLHAHALSFVPWSDENGDSSDRSLDLFWRCNPNNPTGETWPRARVLRWVDAHPRRIHILDAAYAEFADVEPVRPSDAALRENLLLVHSLTKRAGVPGLRLGAIFGRAGLIRRIGQVRPPWAIDALSLLAGEWLIENAATSGVPQIELREARAMRTFFESSGHARTHVSDTHFFLAELIHGTAAELKTFLQRTGLLVRDASNFRGLNKRHVRIAAQSPEQNQGLKEAFLAWTRMHA